MLQFQDLLLQFSHFSLFSVSCRLCCNSVLQFPITKQKNTVTLDICSKLFLLDAAE